MSKLTSKAQTAIPQAVPSAVKLRAGDGIACRIEDGLIVATRVRRDAEEPFATLSEWDSDADRRGHADL